MSVAERIYPDSNKLERLIWQSLYTPGCLKGKHSYRRTIPNKGLRHIIFTCKDCGHTFELSPDMFMELNHEYRFLGKDK